jgi:hypothetical protein
MRKVKKRIFAYQICTPLLNRHTNSLDDKRYDHDRFEWLLNAISSQPANQRAMRFENKLIDMMYYHDSLEDANLIEGLFISTRYGELQDIIDVNTLTTTGNLQDHEGVKNEISFVLCKKTGLLLVQSDSARVVTRNTLDKYFSNKVQLINNIISEFNHNNDPLHIVDNMFFTIQTIVSDDFFKKIRQLARIKEAKVFITLKESKNNAAVEYYQDALESEVDMVDEISISLINKKTRTGIRNVEKFFRKLIELEKYDRYEVQGYTHSNDPKRITFDSQAMDFPVYVSQNDNGLLNRTELVEEMIKIAKYSNPLS